MLDQNKDGYITIDEFKLNMKRVIKLSDRAMEGVFSRMDALNIGMVDMKNFLKTMEKPVMTRVAAVHNDNYDWQFNALNKIREWYVREKFSDEDAFRTLDKEFKGKVD